MPSTDVSTASSAGAAVPPVVPALEADATIVRVPAEPVAAEYGAWSFTRNLARYLGRLLQLPIGAMAVHVNPWSRRPCPRVIVYDLTVGPHHIVVTAFQKRHPLIRGPIDAHALIVDNIQVPFERCGYPEALDWELARAAWIAITDRKVTGQIPGERAGTAEQSAE